jgi:hypothetical protein
MTTRPIATTLPAGTVVKLGGVPIVLHDETVIEYYEGNLGLMTPEALEILGRVNHLKARPTAYYTDEQSVV